MDYSCYADQVVVITGAGGEHGGGVAVGLSKWGPKLALIDIHEGRLNERLQQIKDNGLPDSHIFSMIGDLMKQETREAFVEGLTNKFGNQIHMLLNVVGTKRIKNCMETTPEDLDWCLDGNIKLTFSMIQLCVPYMKNLPTGACILNMGSFSSQRPMPEIVAYCMAKAGIDIMTKCISLEFAPYNIRANCIAPAALRSRFNIRFGDIFNTEEQIEKYYHFASMAIPVKPLGNPQDNVVPFLMYLGSDKAKFINGAVIVIDGAYSQTMSNPKKD